MKIVFCVYHKNIRTVKPIKNLFIFKQAFQRYIENFGNDKNGNLDAISDTPSDFEQERNDEGY